MTPRTPDRRPAAFTLVELLVVIGVIALLAGILLVALSRARGQGERAAMSFQLNSIALALDAYKSDFGDYPRLPRVGSRTAGVDDNGASLLARALIAPAPAGGVGGDGDDGPGFRAIPGGPARPPYLQADKFRVRRTGGNEYSWQIVDTSDRPVLYYAARAARPNVGLANGYLLPVAGAGDNNAALDLSYCEPATYFQQGRTAAAVILGDTNVDGAISGTEAAVAAPFLLWTAGDDGIFGPPTATAPVAVGNAAGNTAAAQKCDDVTNFR